MSHCTNFKFQYTDRKLITQAFSNLGLTYKDSVVYSFASAYTKSLGIASEKRPAIISENQGFNYYMEDFGNHYELSIEKHTMSSSESRIAKRMGEEFQKQYVKCAVQQIMQQLEQNGYNSLLEENSDGFEIKFGLMYEKSLLVKLQNGRVIESVSGVKGQSCQSLTEALENMLSSADVELNTEWTEEYFKDSQDEALKIYCIDGFKDS